MDLLIFDLDGTLIDSKLDLANSVNAARANLGLGRIENEIVYSYVGNGAPVLIRRALGPEATEAECAHALEYFLTYYREHMLDNTRLYPGVREALDRFHDERIAMAVLTNKPVRFSQALVEGLGVGGHFLRVYGGNSFERKKPDPIGVDKLLEESGARREESMIVGDSAVDVQTGRNAGIRVCGVSYGFQPEGFLEDPPDMLVDNMQELVDALLGVRS
ncbi:MAG: HAD hydrolase-like protein [Bryobacteraceae bacterium]|nr:HAD hydrolase-like protein [Bryobacteraceae bacterium]